MKTDSPSVNARDAGLRLISRINRWTIAGAIALSGVISLVAAKSFHGRTLKTAGVAQTQPSGSESDSSSSSSGEDGLQQPAQSPGPAPAAPAPVVSGGS